MSKPTRLLAPPPLSTANELKANSGAMLPIPNTVDLNTRLARRGFTNSLIRRRSYATPNEPVPQLFGMTWRELAQRWFGLKP